MNLAQPLAAAVYRHGRPLCMTDAWCILAAALTRDALAELGIESTPLEVSMIFYNAQMVECIRTGRQPDLTDDSPTAPWSVGAEATPDSIAPAHVVTWVPAWSAYIDPSAHQFARPFRGIDVGPAAWLDAEPPPEWGEWEHDDGGRTIIRPTTYDHFRRTRNWRDRHSLTVAKILADIEAVRSHTM